MTQDQNTPRDHGGNLSAAVARFGGTRADWVDLSTGINPQPYPVGQLMDRDWSALPDQAELDALIAAARQFWQVPEGAAILPAPGASALIAMLPALADPGQVHITRPTYNEHAAAFESHGWEICDTPTRDAQVMVHPNNPDGRLWQVSDISADLTIIDESFCDVCPDHSLMTEATRPGTLILKSFGKFWGLAGLRLGFAIGDPALIQRLSNWQGPWAVSGPALRIGARALADTDWADATRARLKTDCARLDALMGPRGATLAGGTDLFRLYHVPDAKTWQNKLAEHHIWSRIFPYSDTYIRLGLPPADMWSRLEAAV